MTFGLGKVARYILLILSAFGIALVLFGLYSDFRPVDSLGDTNEDCIKTDLLSAENGAGIVATAHVTDCTFGLAHGAETIYVYLHRLGEKDSSKSLVFRFDNIKSWDRPHVKWINSTNLHISIREVGEISKQITSLGDIKIFYSIDQLDISAEESSRLTKHDALMLCAWLVLLTSVFVLALISIRGQKASGQVGQP
jgi:hypothetical protein